MNSSILTTTAFAIGAFCLALSGMMLVPMAVDIYDGNADWQAFGAAAAIVAVLSTLLLLASRGRIVPFSARLGFFLVNALWATTSLAASLPLLLAEVPISFTDAIFEAVSGITTTGSTVLSGLDQMPRGLLLWRSIMQWLGGIGIIAMGIVLLPFLRVGGMQIYEMESSNRTDKPVAQFATFGIWLVALYLTLTVACTLGYILTGMTVFDAVNHAMTTVSTGGYSTHDASIGYFNQKGTLMVAIVFMLAGAMPFVAMIRAIVQRDIRKALDPQIPVLLALLVVLSTLVTAAGLYAQADDSLDMMLNATFNVVSIVTTTGYASADYTLWGPPVVGLFLVATLLGGCAGSTSGGIKTYRIVILYRTVTVALKELVYPNGVFVVSYDGMPVGTQVIRSITVFTGSFFAALFVFTAALAATGLDLVTALSGTLTALTNVGPGLGSVIGPAGNFSTLPDFAKWVLCLAMLMGRLEILTVAVLFSPVFWRR